jgi:UDP-N-acetylmuramoyl-tripeptide--D-alanyl-D-alanine ligase
MEFTDIARALTTLKQKSKWRMEVHQVPGNVTIINDAYNANPESMTAALETLTAIPATGKTFSILGKMHELGHDSDAIHEQIAKLAKAYGLSALANEAETKETSGSNVQKSVWLPDFDSACDYIVKEVNSGDILLFKASRAEQFEVLADRIEVVLRAKWGRQ